MESLGRFMAILTAIVLIMLLPLQYMAQMHDINIESYVKSQTSEFAHKIRHERKITKADYEKYINSINKKGMYYDIEIEISHPITGKDIAQVSESKILNTTNTNSLKAARLNHSTMSNDIKLFSGHTHTDDCYNGMPHICNGYDCVFNTNPIVVAYGASSSNKYNFYYSTDGGITFLPSNFESSNQRIVGITYGNGKFVAIGSGGPNGSSLSYVSTDGINWTAGQTLTIFDYFDHRTYYFKYYYITYENGYFYLLASAMYNGQELGGTFRILRSSDGLTWDSIYTHSEYSDPSYKSFLRGMAIVNDGTNSYIVILSSAASGVLSSYKLNSSTGYITDRQEFYTPTAFRFCQVGPNIAAGIVRDESFVFTASGCTSIKDQRSNNLSMQTLQYGNSIYLGINNNEPYIRNSSTAWTFEKKDNHNLTFPGSPNWHYMIYAGNKFMLVSDDGNRTTISFTLDGENWSQIEPQFRITNYFSGLAVIAAGVTRGTGEGTTGPCLKKGKYYDENGNEVGPICHQVVTSITATHPNQTVKKGEPIITTALATYLDGHTDTVICTSNFNPEQLGIQNVTLTYTGLVGNAKTTGTITDSITVTVIPNKKLTSISVTPTAQSIPRYTNPIFTARAHYDDGSSEIISPSKYSILGFNSAILGVQNVTISYTEEDITKTASATVEVTPMQITCPICGHIYELTPDNIDAGCPVCNEVLINISASPTYIIVEKGEELNITVTATYRSGRINIISDWTSDFNNEQLGTQEVTISYGGKTTKITVYVVFQRKVCDICGYEYDLEIDGSDSGCPICRSTIIGITTEPKEVTINKYDPIPITVTATFRDGHTEEITDWTSNLPIGEIGVFDVTIRYQDFYDNISVTVIDQGLIICPICDTQYYYRDSPRGCPVCSATVVGIEAYLKNGGTKVLKGSNLDLSVVLIYQDEHKKFLYEGYIITGYDPNLLGEQTVIITYNEFQTTLIIEVVESLQIVQCPNGHIYYLNPDGTDPGCPFCGAEEDSNLSEAIFYIDITYTDEILELLYENEVIYLEKGDYITIKITKNKKTYTNGIVTLFSKKDWYNKTFIYGGEVL